MSWGDVGAVLGYELGRWGAALRGACWGDPAPAHCLLPSSPPLCSLWGTVPAPVLGCPPGFQPLDSRPAGPIAPGTGGVLYPSKRSSASGLPARHSQTLLSGPAVPCAGSSWLPGFIFRGFGLVPDEVSSGPRAGAAVRLRLCWQHSSPRRISFPGSAGAAEATAPASLLAAALPAQSIRPPPAFPHARPCPLDSPPASPDLVLEAMWGDIPILFCLSMPLAAFFSLHLPPGPRSLMEARKKIAPRCILLGALSAGCLCVILRHRVASAAQGLPSWLGASQRTAWQRPSRRPGQLSCVSCLQKTRSEEKTRAGGVGAGRKVQMS